MTELLAERPPKRALGLDRASIYILGAALSLATMGALVHAVGSRCDWLVISLVRALLMLATAATLARSSGSKLAVWRPRTLWVRSLAGSCSLVCNFYALSKLPIADAITLMNIQPLWILLITLIIFRRLPSPGELIGVACGLTGVALLERPHLSGDRLAAFVALLSSASSAVAMLGLHRLRHLDSRAVVAHFAGVASLVSLGWLCLRHDAITPGLLEPTTWLYLLAIGATGTPGADPSHQGLCGRGAGKGRRGRADAGAFSGWVSDVAIWGRVLEPTAIAGFRAGPGPDDLLGIRSARSSRSSRS